MGWYPALGHVVVTWWRYVVATPPAGCGLREGVPLCVPLCVARSAPRGPPQYVRHHPKGWGGVGRVPAATQCSAESPCVSVARRGSLRKRAFCLRRATCSGAGLGLRLGLALGYALGLAEDPLCIVACRRRVSTAARRKHCNTAAAVTAPRTIRC